MFLKAGFLGFAGSGKTHTVGLLAAELCRHYKYTGKVALFDTENTAFQVRRVLSNVGGPAVHAANARSFGQMCAFARAVEAGKNECAPVLIVDSITHVWRELCDSYMRQLNQAREAQGQPPRRRMTLQDICRIKEIWYPWPTYFLNSRLHILICGRAGYEWGQEEDDSGNKELVKTGIKMKVEGEFGFEPSLVVQMVLNQREQAGRFVLEHTAYILKDRLGLLTGKEIKEPAGNAWTEYLSELDAIEAGTVDAQTETATGADVDGNTAWSREKRQRQINAEEIKAEFEKRAGGQTADAKARRIGLMESAFGTPSWTAIENMHSDKQRAGLVALRAALDAEAPAAEPPPAEPKPKTRREK